MYFTTGKKPGPGASALAEALASAVPGSVFRRRGRKSIANIASVCRRMSFSRACIVQTRGGSCELLFLGVRHDSHAWLPLKFRVSGFRAVRRAGRANFTGECGFGAMGVMESLFEPAETLSDEKVILAPAGKSKSKWAFKYGGKTLLSIEGSHEKTC